MSYLFNFPSFYQLKIFGDYYIHQIPYYVIFSRVLLDPLGYKYLS
jgi:hypothetical protein